MNGPVRRRRSPAATRVSALLGVLAAATIALPASGQITPGRIYGGGEQISEPSLGLTLTLPDGWRGALPPGASVFAMEADSGDGYMFVIADQLNEQQARTQLAQPVDLGDGIYLTPSGQVRQIATGHLTAPFSVSGATQQLVANVDVRLTQSGLGVAFVLLAPPVANDGHMETMREFALSLGITEPVQPQATGSDAEWQPYLRGRYLARYYTGSGYTESSELWLCSDGSFWYNDEAGGYGGGASGAYQGRGGGQWSATGAGPRGTLILQWASGERSEWALAYDYQQDRLYINDQRWLRGNNERCS